MILDSRLFSLSKYMVRINQISTSMDFEEVGFLTDFWSCKRAEISHKSQESYMMMITRIEDHPFLEIACQGLSMSFKDIGVFGILLINCLWMCIGKPAQNYKWEMTHNDKWLKMKRGPKLQLTNDSKWQLTNYFGVIYQEISAQLLLELSIILDDLSSDPARCWA